MDLNLLSRTEEKYFWHFQNFFSKNVAAMATNVFLLQKLFSQKWNRLEKIFGAQIVALGPGYKKVMVKICIGTLIRAKMGKNKSENGHLW